MPSIDRDYEYAKFNLTGATRFHPLMYRPRKCTGLNSDIFDGKARSRNKTLLYFCLYILK